MHAAFTRRKFLAVAALAFSRARIGRAAELGDAPKFAAQFGKQGSGPGEFNSPIGIASDAQGQLYVTDFLNKRVQKFTADGAFLAAFPVQPFGGGLAVTPDGHFYVSHWNDHKVALYSPAGERLHEWGKKGEGDGEFWLTGGLALSSSGTLYVADQGNSRIQAFTGEGAFLRKWGHLGSAHGEFGAGKSRGSRFAGPQFLAVGQDGSVYATDAVLGRVQKFTPEGEFLLAFGSNATSPGGFGGRKDPPVEGPIGIAVDGEGRIWVGASNNLVQCFSPDGTYLYGIGGSGERPGKFDTPHGLLIDAAGDLWVVDTMNCRVQKFTVPA